MAAFPSICLAPPEHDFPAFPLVFFVAVWYIIAIFVLCSRLCSVRCFHSELLPRTIEWSAMPARFSRKRPSPFCSFCFCFDKQDRKNIYVYCFLKRIKERREHERIPVG